MSSVAVLIIALRVNNRKKVMVLNHKDEINMLTHCRLNELPHTLYWKILISI